MPEPFDFHQKIAVILGTFVLPTLCSIFRKILFRYYDPKYDYIVHNAQILNFRNCRKLFLVKSRNFNRLQVESVESMSIDRLYRLESTAILSTDPQPYFQPSFDKMTKLN